MLLEFTLVNSIVEKGKGAPPRSLFVIMNQLIGVHEPPPLAKDPYEPPDVDYPLTVHRCVISLRSGQVHEVAESVEDVLDAMKFATRHIGVNPGIVDKVDGEKEEMYPWRRGEKVTELARKWRAQQQAMSNVGKRPRPVYHPPGTKVGSAVVDPQFVTPPLQPSSSESKDEVPSVACVSSALDSGSSEASVPDQK
jgi:hypothetical protein